MSLSSLALTLCYVFGVCSILWQLLGVPRFYRFCPFKVLVRREKKSKSSCFGLVGLSSVHFLQVSGYKRVFKETAVILRGTGSISLIWSCLEDGTKPPLREDIEGREMASLSRRTK